MAIWLSTLPAPEKRLAVEPVDTRTIRDLESGRKEIRNFGSDAPDKVTCIFRLQGSLIDSFNHFYDRDLDSGVNWFAADWLPLMGYPDHKARFLGRPEVVGHYPFYSDVSATLLVQRAVYVPDDVFWPCAGPGGEPPPPPVTDSEIVMWGDELGGEISLMPAGLTGIDVAVGGKVAVALKADGTIVVWGDDAPTYFTGWENVGGIKAIAMASQTLICLTTAGAIQIVGRVINDLDQYPVINDGVSVYCNKFAGLVVRETGELVQWGDALMPAVPAGLTDPKWVSEGGDYEYAAIDQAGELFLWAYLNDYNIIPPPVSANVAAVGICRNSGTALDTAGTWYEWGDVPNPAEVPAGFNPILLKTSYKTNTGIHSDNTVVSWGAGYPVTVQIPAGLKATKLDTYGYFVAIAVKLV